MAYFSTDPDGLGEFGCGADCSCKSCRSASNVGEVYEKEEIPPPAPATPPTAAKMGGWFGEPPLSRPRVSVMPGQLRMPPFEVLTGYAPGHWRLNQAQLARIQRLAQHIVRAWTTPSPVTGVRLIGFAEPPEAQAGLQRALAARAALTDAISRLNPGVLRGIKFSAEEGGSAPASGGGVRRVEILLWVGLGTPFAPPLQPSPWSVPRTRVGPPARIPTPEEAARSVHRPETPEQRINRILRTLPPAPPPRRSFNQMFWQRVDDNLNSTMNRLALPQSFRSPIRDAAHAALETGAESLLNKALDQTDLGNEAKEAIRASVRAAAWTPTR